MKKAQLSSNNKNNISNFFNFLKFTANSLGQKVKNHFHQC